MKCPHVTKSELSGDEHGWCVVCLRAEVKDLKARLREIWKLNLGPDWRHAHYRTAEVCDLRRKNWRKP